MSYHLSRPIGQTPPPEPTAQALLILATCAVPVLPIAAGIAGGFYVAKDKSAVLPVVGGLLGALFSVVMLRGKVIEGSASFGPNSA